MLLLRSKQLYLLPQWPTLLLIVNQSFCFRLTAKVWP